MRFECCQCIHISRVVCLHTLFSLFPFLFSIGTTKSPYRLCRENTKICTTRGVLFRYFDCRVIRLDWMLEGGFTESKGAGWYAGAVNEDDVRGKYDELADDVSVAMSAVCMLVTSFVPRTHWLAKPVRGLVRFAFKSFTRGIFLLGTLMYMLTLIPFLLCRFWFRSMRFTTFCFHACYEDFECIIQD